jgi:flagellar biosynthesis/type III secretory pathway chaperone
MEKSATDFISHLTAERDGLLSLIALLESEQQALVKGYEEQLLELSIRKTQIVHELGKLANLRKNDLRIHDAEISVNGLIAWLKAYAPSCLPIWQEIQRFVGQMQNINRNNGTLIQTKLRINQQALAVLLNTTNGTYGLYGADGQQHLHTASRILSSV